MLRITFVEKGDAGFEVKLEGRLLAPWVNEVSDLFAASRERQSKTLDLSKLSFADAAGANLLLSLREQGVQIKACSPFVAELLQLNRSLPGELPS